MVIGPVAVALMLALLVLAWVRQRRRRGAAQPKVRRGPGPAAAGAFYELLNEDRRRAIEIIVEERAEAADPETRDGNLPDLESPKPYRPAGSSLPIQSPELKSVKST